jgi:predicted HTH transcriptional regulator
MKSWVNRAFGLLKACLEQPRHELNELDWKAALSPDKKRLAEHLSAFANYPGGGFLVYGVDASGIPHAVDEETIQKTINHLANIGRQGVEPSVSLDHAVENYESVPLLFVYVPEAPVKPVHIRGKSLEVAFIRSGGTTRQASRQEIGTLMLNSRTPRWEELRASVLLTDADLILKLNTEPIFKMMERPIPTTNEEKLNWMVAEGFICKEPAGGGYVTNLGAIAAARKIADFQDLSRKALRIVVYDGLNKSKTKREQEGAYGYAIGFQGILQFLTSLLPQSEVIEKALRVKRTVYPEIALRELVANALIHQDFSVTGVSPLIEIFDDRIEISNPGGLLPSKQLDRLIGTQPESRNEKLASAFRRYKICEERGSGLVKAGEQVEIYGLPPIEFYSGSNHFKVTLYSPRTFAQMSARERLEACYQHAVLKYYSDSAMTNKSLRERLKMPEKQRSMVSNLIQEALSLKKIKPANPENKSRKFTEYVPFWA